LGCLRQYNKFKSCTNVNTNAKCVIKCKNTKFKIFIINEEDKDKIYQTGKYKVEAEITFLMQNGAI